MNGFAVAWSKYLPENHRKALHTALYILSDEFFDTSLEDEEHIFRELLPRKYFNQYTPPFLKIFFIALLTVGYKLSLTENSETLIACTAEELALNILIKRAEAILADEGIEADFSTFEDMIFQDIDFEFLYDTENDGIEEIKELHIANLRFFEWFKPFDNASMPVHPLCLDNKHID